MATVKSRSGAKSEVQSVPEGPDRFYNRELSWLQFNRRVLEEAGNQHHPLLERLRFLSIAAANLDEFYMVRAAGVYGQIRAGITTLSQDGMTPMQQLATINKFATVLVADKQANWRVIKDELAGAGLFVLQPDELTKSQHDWLERLFMTHIFPILTPIAADPAHPFPFMPNKAMTIVVEMVRPSDGKTMNGLIPIPGQLERFVRLESEPEKPKEVRFIQLENVIGMFLTELFSGFQIKSQGAFRVLRDSDIEFQEEAEDLVRSYESQLKRRRRGNVIRLEIEARMPERLRKFVIDELEVREESIFVKEGILALSLIHI